MATYLNPRLRQIDAQRHFLAEEHVRIMRLLEQRLQLLQLLWRERRSVATLETAFRHERHQHSDITLTHTYKHTLKAAHDNVTETQSVRPPTFPYPSPCSEPATCPTPVPHPTPLF